MNTCAICGEYREMSFEHVPPKSCFNDHKIYMHTSENILHENSPLYGKRKVSHKGFGAYTLCIQCNNTTGALYGEAYKDWVRQGAYILKITKLNPSLPIAYCIKPLNALKQIISMFMSAEKCGLLRNDRELVQFVIQPENCRLPSKYSVYSYLTTARVKRLLGYSVSVDFELSSRANHWSELSFFPFGYLLAIDSPPPNREMVNITEFKNFLFNEKTSVRLKLPFLETNTLIIGDYRKESEVDWELMPYKKPAAYEF